MQTEALELARQSTYSGRPECLSYGVVEIQVTDLERTVKFWTRALGLSVREQNSERASLGTQARTLITFHAGASRSAENGYLGMYHVAIGVPDQSEFSRILARLIEMRISIAPVDHLMSKAVYLHDPDGLEIEIAFETPERFSRFGNMDGAIELFDTEGKKHNGRERLDVENELSFARGADLLAPLSNDSFLAHLHFKVSDLESALAWYEKLGFARNLFLPGVGFADMGAGASYTHRLAMNIWAGKNLSPAPAGMARLICYELHVHDASVLKDAHGLQPTETGFTGLDPAGIDVSLNFKY